MGALLPLKIEAANANTVFDVLKGASVTWTDISSFVLFNQGVNFNRGRTAEATSTSPGSASFTTKTKPDGTTAGLEVRRPIRISAYYGLAWQTLWTGSVAEVRFGWENGVRGVQEIACTDNVAVAERRVLQAWPAETALSIGDVALLFPLDDRDSESAPREISGANPPDLRARPVGLTPEGAAVTLGSGSGPGSEGTVATFTGADSSGGWCLEAYSVSGRIAPLTTDNTISVFVWIDADPTRTLVAVSTTYDHYSSNLRVDVGVSPDGVAYAGWTLKIGGPSFLIGTTKLATGRWHHIAAVFDEVGTGFFNAKLYVNGVEEAASSGTAFPFAIAGYGIRIGAGFSTVTPFDGQIAHVGIFNKALTAAQVQSLAGAVTGYAGESTVARFNRVQRLVGYSTSTASGGIGVMGPQPIGGKTVAGVLGEVSTVEHAQWWCAANGTMKLASRADRYNRSSTTTPRHALDVPGLLEDLAIPASAVSPSTTFSQSDKDMANVITGNRPGGATYTKRDATSIAAYGEKSRSSTYFAGSDGEVTTYVDADLATSAFPNFNVESFTVNATAVQSTVLHGDLLELDVDSLIKVTGIPSGTTTSSSWYFVEGTTDRVSPAGWQRTLNVTFAASELTMVDRSTAEAWVLNNNNYGLGSGGGLSPAKPYGSRLGL